MLREEDALVQEDAGSVTSLMSTHVVETHWRGRIGKGVMDRAYEDMTRMLRSHTVHYWLADTKDVSGYSADIRTPATALLRALKEHGVREVISIVPSGPVRMLSTALALAVGFKLKMFATRDEALDYVRAKDSM
jgi:hypothetical protein